MHVLYTPQRFFFLFNFSPSFEILYVWVRDINKMLSLFTSKKKTVHGKLRKEKQKVETHQFSFTFCRTIVLTLLTALFVHSWLESTPSIVFLITIFFLLAWIEEQKYVVSICCVTIIFRDRFFFFNYTVEYSCLTKLNILKGYV